MTLAIRLCVCIRSQYDAAHMPGKPSVMSDSGNILMTMTNTQEPQNTNTSGALAVAKAAAGLKLYDTASHAVSSFTPIKPGQVGIYVCGATVQSSPHIGHIRAAVAFDVVRRWFERLGYKVTFVRNVTDIDDKILDKAAAAGQQWWERAYIYEREFTEAYSKLGVEPPTYEPRATGHMIDMIDLIKKIIDNGHAYVVRDADGNPTGNVYFDVASWPHYGELTHQKQTAVSDAASEVTDAMGPSVDNAGNDKYNPVDPADMSPDKHDPRDFALWKAPKDSDPLDARWNTPFGTGRPGWHIECSAMSMKYLGESFDFHGGGSDLIFPHHENEIAQSEGCTGVHPFVRYWLHNGFITVNEEKMSKSLGNFFTVADILEHFEPETLRFFILSTHYRSPLDFSDERLKEARRSLARLKTAQDNLKELAQLISGGPTETSKALYAKLEELRSGFMEAMSDDFNTALAISFMFELAKEINIYHQHISTGSEKPDGKLVENMEKLFAEFCGIIGVLETSAQPAAEKDASLEDKLIETVVSLRQEARAAKNYAQADALRNALTGLGIVLEDTPQGVRWKKQ